MDYFQEIKNVVIVGQGAMGILWYHHLVNQKDVALNVHLLASEQQNKLSSPYYFESFKNSQPCSGNLLFAQPQQIKNADIILLCLKSYHVLDAIKQLMNQVNNQVIILLAHNGIGTFEQLPKPFKEKHAILAMLTTHASLKTGDFKIKHTGLGVSDIGLLSQNASDKQLDNLLQISQMLSFALPKVTYHHDIRPLQWLKLAINCVINPVTAINNIENGLITSHKYTQLIDDILTELVSVAEAENIMFSKKTLKEKIMAVARATAKNSSSMRCDILAKRKTEINYINGYIHRLGRKHGIATPTNSQLFKKIKTLK